MTKSFELRENGVLSYGIIENIPEDITLEEIAERIETSSNNVSVELTEHENTPDIILDWISLDYIQELDSDFLEVSDVVYLATKKDILIDVVYVALKNMKENNTLTIAEAIKNSFLTIK